jgi:hypothetical protein
MYIMTVTGHFLQRLLEPSFGGDGGHLKLTHCSPLAEVDVGGRLAQRFQCLTGLGKGTQQEQ